MRSRRLGRGVRLAVAVGTALAFACSCTSGSTPTDRAVGRPAANGVRPLAAARERHGQDLRHAGRRGPAHRGRSTAQRNRHGRSAAGHRPRTDGDAGLPRSSRPDRVQPRHAELEPAGTRTCRAVRQAALRLPLRHGRHGHDAGDQPGRPEVRGGGRTPSRAEVRSPGVRRSSRPAGRGPGRARHGRPHGRLQRQHTRARQVRLPEDHHQRRVGRPLHLHRTDDHPRVAAHPAQLPGEPQAAPGVPEDGLLPDHATTSTSTSRRRTT